MEKKVQSIIFGVTLLYLGCYFMQIFNFPNVIMLFLGGVLCAGMVIAQKKLRVDIGLILLALTMLSYAVLLFGKRGIITMLPYIPLVVYVLTNYQTADICKSRQSNDKLLILLFVFAAGYSVHGILNSYMYFAGYVVEGTRRWNDFWSNNVVPGTQHVIYFLPAFVFLFPMIANWKKRKALCCCVSLLTVFFIYTSLATRIRMAFLILAGVLCTQLFLFVIFEREKFQKIVRKKSVWVIGAVVLAAAAVGIYLLKDTSLISNFVDSLGRGGGILNNVRFETQRKALEQLFLYPMGGRQMDLGRSYAHNVWLDMANAAGLIPFTAFTVYTLYTAYELIKLLFKKNVSTENKMLFAGMYVAFFLYYTVEPALDASIHYITPWILVHGMIRGCLD